MASYIIVPGNAEGKILTSTLWQQSGRIVIDGQEISGCSYNLYCPYISTSSRIRSVTGCTNTADAQILYYYLEQGWDLQLSVSSADYFVLSSNRRKIYYLSETSAVGEGTISVLNAVLADTENFATGKFIAALNFFCGVKNHSYYGNSTGTSVYMGTYFDGLTNLKAFRAAGFDSYFSVGDTNETFFDTQGSKNRLTDVAYSIIRENLDYGEPVRVDIPGHSIYLDGYRWNEATRQYEYHLNYGWGVDSTETKWYTEDEIYKVSFDCLGLDLTPKVRVTVSNDRSDYYGGSFLRGVERINHIQNDTATTFGFVEEISGKTLFLETVTFSSKVDLEFLNWNINLSVFGKDALCSDNALYFTGQTGGIIVKSASGNACVVGSADEILHAELSGGYYFTGKTDESFENIVHCVNNFWNYTDELLACINSYAVISGRNNDVIYLNEESVIVGGVDLGAGKNRIDIESGSAIYGNIAGSDDSVELNLHASDTGERTMLHLTGSNHDFLSVTGGNINFIVKEDSISGLYKLLEFQNDSITEDFLNNFTVTVKFAGQDYILDSRNCHSGNYQLQFFDDTVALYLGNEYPSISVMASENQLTNGTVSVTAVFYYNGNKIEGEYSLDQGQTWNIYQEALSVTQNCTLTFRVRHEDGYIYKDFEVQNIDKTAPVISDISVELNAGKKRVTVSAVFSDDRELKSAQYKIGSDGLWVEYTDPFVVRENATVFFRGIDKAGNIVEKSVVIDSIEHRGFVEDDLDGNGLADVLLVQNKYSGKNKFSTGAWLLSEENSLEWLNLSNCAFYNDILGIGKSLPEKKSADIYLLDRRKNTVGFWETDSNGKVTRWQTIETFDNKTQVLGLGDFDGDGVTDLLLQNVNGAVGCGFVSENKCTWNYFKSLGKEWHLSAIGDFNDDGQDDVVLAHDAGFSGCWLTQADGTVRWSDLSTLSPNAKIVGDGDFNGDGTDDLLIQSGDYYGAWIIKNGNVTSWMGLGTEKGQVEQIADFTGDGIDDLRLRRSSGDIGILAVNGADDLDWIYLGSVDREWTTVSNYL